MIRTRGSSAAACFRIASYVAGEPSSTTRISWLVQVCATSERTAVSSARSGRNAVTIVVIRRGWPVRWTGLEVGGSGGGGRGPGAGAGAGGARGPPPPGGPARGGGGTGGGVPPPRPPPAGVGVGGVGPQRRRVRLGAPAVLGQQRRRQP